MNRTAIIEGDGLDDNLIDLFQVVCSNAAMTPTRPTARVDQSVPASLDELACTIDRLWRSEPDVAPSRRSRLLERLAHLEHDTMRLALQHQVDGIVDDALLRSCLVEADELRWWWRPTGRGRHATGRDEPPHDHESRPNQ